jgi:hypothetical protein
LITLLFLGDHRDAIQSSTIVKSYLLKTVKQYQLVRLTVPVCLTSLNQPIA